MSDQPVKLGRPRKYPIEAGKRLSHSVLLCPADRARIIAAAALRGRSMSEEMADRINRSFRDDDVRNLLREAVGGYGDLDKSPEKCTC